MGNQKGFCGFCKKDKEQIAGVTFGKVICEDCSKNLHTTNDPTPAEQVTPFEEINELVKRMKVAKDTLEGTDLEYFSKEQLVELNKLSNQLAEISFRYISTLEDTN